MLSGISGRDLRSGRFLAPLSMTHFFSVPPCLRGDRPRSTIPAMTQAPDNLLVLAYDTNSASAMRWGRVAAGSALLAAYAGAKLLLWCAPDFPDGPTPAQEVVW